MVNPAAVEAVEGMAVAVAVADTTFMHAAPEKEQTHRKVEVAVLSVSFGAQAAPSHQQTQGTYNGNSFKHPSSGKRIDGFRHSAC
jgi:hypothetical protein